MFSVSVKRKKLINVPKSLRSGVSDGLLGVALAGEAQSKALVRVDTGQLRNDIQAERVSSNESKWGTTVAHAKAQEFGRPDLKGYGFTPYLRPAVDIIKSVASKIMARFVRKGLRG